MVLLFCATTRLLLRRVQWDSEEVPKRLRRARYHLRARFVASASPQTAKFVVVASTAGPLVVGTEEGQYAGPLAPALSGSDCRGSDVEQCDGGWLVALRVELENSVQHVDTADQDDAATCGTMCTSVQGAHADSTVIDSRQHVLAPPKPAALVRAAANFGLSAYATLTLGAVKMLLAVHPGQRRVRLYWLAAAVGGAAICPRCHSAHATTGCRVGSTS